MPRFCHGADVEVSQDIPVIIPSTISPYNQHGSLGVSRNAPLLEAHALCPVEVENALHMSNDSYLWPGPCAVF